MSLSLQANTSAAGVSGLSPKSQARGVAAGRGRRRAEGRVVGEAIGCSGQTPGVDVTEDDALAGERLAADLVPDGRGADELGALDGVGLQQGVGLHRGHAGDGQHLADLVGRQPHGDAAVDRAAGSCRPWPTAPRRRVGDGRRVEAAGVGLVGPLGPDRPVISWPVTLGLVAARPATSPL